MNLTESRNEAIPQTIFLKDTFNEPQQQNANNSSKRQQPEVQFAEAQVSDRVEFSMFETPSS